MILVVNLNPSLDKIYTVKKLRYGEAVRAAAVQNTAGGKGSHVANVLTLLGESCTVIGFLGGSIGQSIAKVYQERGIQQDCTFIQDETRVCINIAAEDGTQTEVLEPGPEILHKEKMSFFTTYKDYLARQDVAIIVASGSLPRGLNKDFYAELIKLAHAAGKTFLLDTSGEALRAGIEAGADFIKPNQDELAELTGHYSNSVAEAWHELEKLMQGQVQMPAISLGKSGALWARDGKVYQARPPRLKTVNAVGSGDSFVAGLACGVSRGLSTIETLRLASACGTANVLEEESGWISPEKVKEISGQVEVSCLSL